jgi:hypothetical protein
MSKSSIGAVRTEFAAVYARWLAQRLADQAQLARLAAGAAPAPEDDAWGAIHDCMFPLCEEILRRPARGLPDLALQARAAALLNPELWTDEDDACSAALRRLIDNICARAGVAALPGIEARP